MKQLIKKIIPLKLWKKIRLFLIVHKHKDIARICNKIIDNYVTEKCENFPIRPKKQFENSLIIWQYWAQGYENVPEVVQICLDSVERHKGKYQLIRLSDENLSQYLDIPDAINRKRGSFLMAHFSDLLRMALLSTYGGVWLDATVFLTGELPQRYFDYGFFMYQRDINVEHKDYWENAYAYYWGWNPDFKVCILNSIIYSEKGNKTVEELCNLLYITWLRNDSIPYYYYTQILFYEYFQCYPQNNCPIESDCLPHYMMQLLTDDYPYLSFEQIIELTPIHKLTYKMPDFCVDKLKELKKQYFQRI